MSVRKTAYEVAQRVMELAFEEPKRLNMDNWSFDTTEWDRSRKPACGTVGCWSGWIATAVKGKMTWGNSTSGSSILLGHDPVTDEDFQMRQELSKIFYTFPDQKLMGTKEYVDRAARPFKAWIKRWKHELERITVNVEDSAIETWWND